MFDKMPEKKVWVVNKGELVEHIDIQLKKHIYLKKDIPQQFPLSIGLGYVNKFKDVQLCANPEEYFQSKKLKRLILRDAGIGDLLMLEPILRKMGQDQNIEIDVACMYPEVYENHPNINKILKIDGKEHINNLRFSDYDCWEDLRNYSETSPDRDKRHRTDIYNNPFNIEMSNDEKQPRLHFKKTEKSYIKKKKGYKYIGIQCDASHGYRRYDRGRELIDYLLQKDKNYILVLLGSFDFIKNIHNKRIIDLQGQTTRREAIRVIRDLDYFIAADSGLMHVALTLHTPVVCMFSIITPHFRVAYYQGPKKVIWKDISCKGCGDYHMVECKHGSKKKNIDYLAPCMNIDPEEIYNNMIQMEINDNKRVFFWDNNIVEDRGVLHGNGKKKVVEKNINIIAQPTNKKLTMPIIVQDEEKNLPRFIENVINNKYIGKVIAIDGGSNDKTVELLESAGAYVYVHNYDKDFHDMQAMQRNYSCSFIKDGEKIIIMDIDECFSEELANYLPELAESTIAYGLISRKTFNYYSDITEESKRIKDYPDWQPRFFTWNRRFKWIGSPHHAIYNTPEPVMIQKDIIHFEKENKDRDALENKWATMQAKTRAIYA
jgi:ADP-heptose:LPS heptosyltransferase